MGSENNNFLKGEIGTEADKGKHCNAKFILKLFLKIIIHEWKILLCTDEYRK